VEDRVLEDRAQSIECRQAARANGTFNEPDERQRGDHGSGSRHQRVSFIPGLQTSPAACDTTDSRFGPKAVLRCDPRAGEISHVVRFAWTTLYWNVAVVLCGAYVRATGSGAGCGNRWPLCDGDVIGASAKTQTIVEFTHRIISAISLLMVTLLVVWCWRVTKKGDWARYSAVLAAAVLANEALLGAALVLLKHVGNDQSAGRILFLCLHFGNTLLLLATLSLTAAWLSNGSRSFTLISKWREVGSIGLGLLATMVTGITGAVAALADTLYPATSLPSSLAQDFSSGTPALLRVRLLHPAIATVGVGYVLWVILRSSTGRNRFSRSAIALIIFLFVQVGVGMTNVLFLAPVWLQIAHLFVADALWILLVLLSADLVLEPAVTCPAGALASVLQEGRKG
jgi:cytochrome c oxidase assembly protein subunit 15